MNALQVINHKTTSRPPIIAKWHMYSNSLEYRIRRCLTAIPMLELKALLRFSHIRGARYEGKKGNADPKHRPLSSAIFGPVDILLFFVFHLGRISPEVGVSRFSISIPAYQRKTPWISFYRMVLITNYFTFLLRSFSGDLASPRLSGRKFHNFTPVRRFLSISVSVAFTGFTVSCYDMRADLDTVALATTVEVEKRCYILGNL